MELKFTEKTESLDIKLLNSGEWKVITEKGDIICEHVVNAAGSYGPRSWTNGWIKEYTLH